MLTVPFRWFNFEKVVQALVNQKTYYLRLEQLQTIIQEVCFIDNENEVTTMLDFYHDLGIIARHRNTVVLQAQWLIDLFKQLITIRPYNDMVRNYITLSFLYSNSFRFDLFARGLLMSYSKCHGGASDFFGGLKFFRFQTV